MSNTNHPAAEIRECCGRRWLNSDGPQHCPRCGDLAACGVLPVSTLSDRKEQTMSTTLTTNEISNLGYWDRFCELRGYSVWAMNEGQVRDGEEFEFTREEMEMLRGTREMPKAEKELPEWRLDEDTNTIDELSANKQSWRVIASSVELKQGDLMADAPRMLKALRVLHADGHLVPRGAEIAESVHDDWSSSGEAGRKRVAAWEEAVAIAEEVVKRHADL